MNTSDNTLLSKGNTKTLVCVATTRNTPKTSTDKDALRIYIESARAPATKAAYRCDVRHFMEWGGGLPTSANCVAQYLAAHASTHTPATLQRRLAALKVAHDLLGEPSPTSDAIVRDAMRGIRRVHGSAQRQVQPLVREDMLALTANAPSSLTEFRDRAVLLVGFASALRRAELVSLQVSDLSFGREGMTIFIRRSKTDQAGEGRRIAIPFARSHACPVKAIQLWLQAAQISDGAVFRSIAKGQRLSPDTLSSQGVALIVKRAAGRLGMPTAAFSGHSLRSGFVTSAARLGVSSWKIRAQTGHKGDSMLTRYIRDAELFIENAAGAVL